jgi:hypothetical protein
MLVGQRLTFPFPFVHLQFHVYIPVNEIGRWEKGCWLGIDWLMDEGWLSIHFPVVSPIPQLLGNDRLTGQPTIGPQMESVWNWIGNRSETNPTFQTYSQGEGLKTRTRVWRTTRRCLVDANSPSLSQLELAEARPKDKEQGIRDVSCWGSTRELEVRTNNPRSYSQALLSLISFPNAIINPILFG